MPGNYSGGKKAEKANKQKYGEDFYKVIGALGGRESGKYKGRSGGFKDRELASRAGRLGGKAGARSKAEAKKVECRVETMGYEPGQCGCPKHPIRMPKVKEGWFSFMSLGKDK